MNNTIGEIIPTHDRKTRARKNQKNTFGLLPGIKGTCPCATVEPGGCWHVREGRKLPECYVAHTMSAYPGVKQVLQHNTALLSAATQDEMVELLHKEFARFRSTEEKHHTKNNIPLYNPLYRLHWSGDIFNEAYAEALAVAIGINTDIKFWCYTRSFFAIPILSNLPNLNLYLSLDPVNVNTGLKAYIKHKGTTALQLCYMNKTNDIQNRHTLLTGSDFMACPVDTGKLGLEEGCHTCTMCTRAQPRPVWFAT